ncbi:uncharacterized protein LOC124935255 [Impatiens glandulifera]|uniref:uncharacterized protein LOC124935255 n=1 Tax=Impatiens glandulifera TaxID=253017 RepID=UPI001FB142C4|nr:uncharacterized protein LOC124935255 [Impatiens glandulifera]
MSTKRLSMKLLVDKENKKVLFAEVGKEVVDFFFFILTLPLAKVTNLLTNSKKEMIGCLSALYKSVETLDQTYIKPGQSKDSLLNPLVSLNQAHLLLPDQPIQTSADIKIYRCPETSHSTFFVRDPNLTCQNQRHSPFGGYEICGRKMSSLDDSFENKATIPTRECGGFVNGMITYMVMDDLMITPMSTISSICLLNQFNIKDVSHLQEIVVDFGMDEGLKILEASLKGKEVLTQVFSFKCFAN